jgi:uncharacterized protein YkwD
MRGGLRRLRSVAILLALAMPLVLAACSAHRRAFVPPSLPDVGTLEREVYARVNAHRASRHRSPLGWSDVVAEQARLHSREMLRRGGRLSHNGFKERVAIIKRTYPWTRAAENVAVSRTAGGVVERWLKKRGHRSNIEGDYDLTGVGAAIAPNGTVYFTQIFIK